MAHSKDNEPKYGIIVFLDALGARTTDISFAKDYLTNVMELKSNIGMLRDAIADVDAGQKIPGIKWNAEQLSFKFFGDSVLMAYEFPSSGSPRSCIDCVVFVVATSICLALKKGILFRGAISIGTYVETNDVFLGPAITDAANWYDRSDMVGAIVTPATMNYLKAIMGLSSKSTEAQVHSPIPRLILYDVPLSRSAKTETKSILTYVIEWPSLLPRYQGEAEPKDSLSIFFECIKNSPIPFGAESKYSNTEAFIKESLKKAQPSN